MRVHPDPREPRRRGTGVVAWLSAVALLAAACTAEPDDPTERGRDGAAAAAILLADGMSRGSLDDVPLVADLDASTAQEDLAEITADPRERLGEDQQADVALVEDSVTVDDAGTEATATLAWAWPFEAGRWQYEAEIRLARGDSSDGSSQEWRVDWSPAAIEPSLQTGETLVARTVAATRGEILGRGGARLVTERRVVRVGIDKTQVRPGRAGGSARVLARELDIAGPPFVTAVRAAGPEAFVEAIVLRADEAAVIPSIVEGIPGARAIGDVVPLAPTREFAAPLLGRVGQATAEIVEDSEGEVQPGDEVGLSGLQRRYDEQLRGSPGFRVSAQSPSGNARVLFSVDADAGDPLPTTLDRGLQGRAEALLAPIDPPSGLVVLRPSTGAVLVAASGPGSDGYTTATFGKYAPGSTFKIVSALALLRAGLGPDSTVPCPASTTVDGKEFSNYDGYPPGDLGPIPLRRAVASSCNTAFVERRGRAPHGRLAAAAAALGLGIDHEVGFPAYFGEVPAPESETEAAADLIGQGTVTASPLSMAVVVASVAAGEAVLPQLLPGVEPDPEGDADPVEQPLEPAEAKALRSMLRLVVADGSGSVLADVPGPPVLAKTGTAEYGSPRPDGSLPTHAWMVAAQGDLAVAAFVEAGESGSGTAGPLVEAMLRAAPMDGRRPSASRSPGAWRRGSPAP